jgi:hypothetical protein
LGVLIPRRHEDLRRFPFLHEHAQVKIRHLSGNAPPAARVRDDDDRVTLAQFVDELFDLRSRENCLRTLEDRIAIAGQDRFLVWIWQPPRQGRTILGMAAAVAFLGLAAADLSRSTTVNSHQAKSGLRGNGSRGSGCRAVGNDGRRLSRH